MTIEYSYIKRKIRSPIQFFFVILAMLFISFFMHTHVTHAAENELNNYDQVETTSDEIEDNDEHLIPEHHSTLEEDMDNSLDPDEESESPLDELEENDVNESIIEDEVIDADELDNENCANDEDHDVVETDEKEYNNPSRNENVDDQSSENISQNVEPTNSIVKNNTKAQTKEYQFGDREKNIIKLKHNLIKVGFGTHWRNPTEYFGRDTEKVVSDFQKYYSLNINGKLDLNTISKLNEILASIFRRGNKDDEIKNIKEELQLIGFGTHWKNPTTLYGSDTEKVVKQFQRENNLVENGIIDEVTLSKIKQFIQDGYTYGKRAPVVQRLKIDLMKVGFGSHWNNPTEYFGKDTKKVVQQFQNYYSLNSTAGVIDTTTISKLYQLLNSPYRKGTRSKSVLNIKKDLMRVGAAPHWRNPTELFGSDTEKVVKEFQNYYGLIVNGIIDDITEQKIDELKSMALKRNMRSEQIRKMKLDLMKIGFGTHWKNPTTLFGKDTKKVVKEFQKYYSLIIDGEMHIGSMNKLKDILNSPYQKGKRSNEIKKLKMDLMTIGFGTHWKSPTTLFGADTEKVVKQFQKAYKLVVNGILDDVSLSKLKSEVKKQKNKVIKIFIDAGHGGSDPGAVSGGLKEKDLTLYIAKKIQQYLGAYKNVVIKMSRTNDRTLSLPERTKMANDWGADFFFSVHINAGGGTGIESYIHNENNTKEEIKLQDIIHSHIANGLKSDNVGDRGKKKANFHVVRETKMSAMLFEYLFIDNKTDQAKLKSNSFLNKLGKLTAEAIAKAFNLRK